MMRCRILGHDYRFRADERTMRWSCVRGCGAGGAKTYPTAADARRYAAAFDHRDRDDLGTRAPLIGLFPLRILRAMRRRKNT